MSDTSQHLTAAMATVALGAAVQGILGFGCSLVWMSLFPLFTTISDAVGVLQPLAIGLNTILLSQLWRHCHLQDLKPLARSAPIGILFGLWVVTAWPSHAINGLLGIFLLVYVGNTCKDDYNNNNNNNQQNNNKSLKREKDDPPIELGNEQQQQQQQQQQKHDEELDVIVLDGSGSGDSSIIDNDLQHQHQQRKTETRSLIHEDFQNTDIPIASSSSSSSLSSSSSSLALPAGFVGGCLASAFGTAGPAILVYAKQVGWEQEPQKFRANLQVIFFTLNVLAISSQTYSGIINKDTIQVSILLLPALVLGGIGGTKLATKVPKDIFRLFVLGGMTIMGIMFLSKAMIVVLARQTQ